MMKRMLSFMLITVLLMLMVPSVAEETVKTIELYANRIDLRQILSQDGITVLMTETQLDGSGKLTLCFAYSASDELRAANNTIYVVPEILAAVGDADPVSLTKKNDRLQVFSEGAVTYYTVDNPDLQDVRCTSWVTLTKIFLYRRFIPAYRTVTDCLHCRILRC